MMQGGDKIASVIGIMIAGVGYADALGHTGAEFGGRDNFYVAPVAENKPFELIIDDDFE